MQNTADSWLIKFLRWYYMPSMQTLHTTNVIHIWTSGGFSSSCLEHDAMPRCIWVPWLITDLTLALCLCIVLKMKSSLILIHLSQLNNLDSAAPLGGAAWSEWSEHYGCGTACACSIDGPLSTIWMWLLSGIDCWRIFTYTPSHDLSSIYFNNKLLIWFWSYLSTYSQHDVFFQNCMW